MASRIPQSRRSPDLTGQDDAIGDAPGDRSATRARIAQLTEQAQERARSSLGYPGNLATNFRDLAGLLATLHNNVGDPVSGGGLKALEREVIAFFAELADAPPRRCVRLCHLRGQ